MPDLTFEGQTFTCNDNETVLECLERHGVEMASSCRSGVCQSCLMRSAEGALPESSQKGLKDTLRVQGYFLACQCSPKEALSVSRADSADRQVKATITRIETLSANVVGVWMTTDHPIQYRPGQFVNFVREGGLLRSYSVASVPALQDELEFHVALMPEGKMSGWLHSEAQAGDTLDLQGPLGSCFYVAGKPDQPLLLVGTGTGLAPLYGIARHALEEGHTAPIHLMHASLAVEGLYLVEELKRLDAAHPNFTYTPCALNGSGRTDVTYGNIMDIALEHHPELKGWRIYLCGHPDTVKTLQRKTFMAGASMSDILADAFLPSQNT